MVLLEPLTGIVAVGWVIDDVVVALLDDEKVEIVDAGMETDVVAVLSVAAMLLVMVEVLELVLGVAVFILAEVVIDPTEVATDGGIIAFTGSDDCMTVFCTTAGCAAEDAIFC